MVAIFSYVFIFLLTLLLFHIMKIISKDRSEAKKRAKLPPGSMGWPYVGETLQLYSQDPNTFFASKQKRFNIFLSENFPYLLLLLFIDWLKRIFLRIFRYGEIFKTHILGCPCVMLASPDAAKFVLVTEAHRFKPTYPKSKERLIGPSALFFHQGDYHIRLRKLVQGSLSLDAIRNLVADIEAVAVSATSSWVSGQVVNTFHELKKVTYNISYKMLRFCSKKFSPLTWVCPIFLDYM